MNTETESLPPATGVNPTLSLMPWEDYQVCNSHVFPRPETWQWFWRQHSEELLARGAICFIGRRMFVIPDRFDETVIEIGQRAAQLRAA